MSDGSHGPLLLSGARHFGDVAAVDREIASRAGGPIVLLPTGAAYERPDHLVTEATAAFALHGATVVPAMVLTRRDAEDPTFSAVVRSASAIYLCGPSTLHVRSVLKDSAVLDAIVAAWHDGAFVAGQGSGAIALCDPMVDPRGGALTVGLGLLRDVAALPESLGLGEAGLRRTTSLLQSGYALVSLADDAAVLREPDGTWRAFGTVDVYVDGALDDLTALAGKRVW